MKSTTQNKFQEDHESIHIWELDTTDFGEPDSYLNLNVFDDGDATTNDCIPVGEIPLHKTGVLLYSGAIRLQGKVLYHQ